MPPRYSYWTIIVGGQPTAFRAATQEELLPTLKQTQVRQPDAVMKWFARGKLWESPEAATEAMRAGRFGEGGGERRGAGWRPGGEHEDPRAKFNVPRAVKRARFVERMHQGDRDPDQNERRGDDRPPQKPRPPRRGGEPPVGPSGDRPFKPRSDRPYRPSADRPPRPSGERPFRPSGDRPFKPFGDRPFRPAGERPGPSQPQGRDDRGGTRPFRPRTEDRGERPFRPKKPGDRPFTPSGDRPFRPRTDDRGERPFRPKGPGDRPFKPSGDRPFKPKGGGGSGGRSGSGRGPTGGRGPSGGGGRGAGGNRGPAGGRGGNFRGGGGKKGGGGGRGGQR